LTGLRDRRLRVGWVRAVAAVEIDAEQGFQLYRGQFAVRQRGIELGGVVCERRRADGCAAGQIAGVELFEVRAELQLHRWHSVDGVPQGGVPQDI